MSTFHDKKGSLHNQHHDDEHASWDRRSFLKTLGLLGGTAFALGGGAVKAAKPSPLLAAINGESDRVLILIRLKGGNDGLNTIVPIYNYDTYAEHRPTIKFDTNELYNLNSSFAIPNYLSDLQALWGDGAMKVVHGVGYDDQNLSHFRSSDIWASTEPEEIIDTGFLGRYYDDQYPDFLTNTPEDPLAIQIGSVGNLIFEGMDSNYAFTVSNPQQLENIANSGVAYDTENLPDCTYGDQLSFMRNIVNTTYVHADSIHSAYDLGDNAVEYTDTRMGNQLSIVARLIKGGLNTKIYMVTLDGFDTHAEQAERHQQLLTDVSENIKLFYDDLAAASKDQDVLSMTFSEFGRRIFENGSAGTDHGAASPILFFGPALEDNGFVGTHPDLDSPDSFGNLEATTNFKSVFATVLQDWMCIHPSLVNDVLLEDDVDLLDLGFYCNSSSIDLFDVQTSFNHETRYEGKDCFIHFEMDNGALVNIRLQNILGQEVATLFNQYLNSGPHQINVRQASKKSWISPGTYTYTITVEGKRYSKKIVL